MKLVHACLNIKKCPETRFYHCCDPVKLVLYHCFGPVKLVEASLDVRKDVESSFHHSADIVKLVHAYLCFRMDDPECRFSDCRCPVKLMKARFPPSESEFWKVRGHVCG